jgi:hypothetical protein
VSSLLQRLAGQAIGTPGTRIRSAAQARARVPLVLPAAGSGRVEGAGVPLPAAEGRFDIEPTPSTEPRIGVIPARPPATAAREGVADRLWPQSPETLPPRVTGRAEQAAHAAAPEPEFPVSNEVPLAPIPAPLLATASPVVMSVPLQTQRPSSVPGPISKQLPEAPTEVHVHIGRIEVTALPSSPATAKRARDTNARPSVPLSEYLARRRRS